MIIIPKVIKDKLDRDNAKFNVRISFPNGERTDICNNMIVNGTTKFTESLCSQDELKFGLCESPQFECETVGVGNIKGCLIDVAYEVICTPDVLGSQWKTDIQEHVFSIPVGRFVVAECDRQADMQHRKVVAYGGGSATKWEMPLFERIKARLAGGEYEVDVFRIIASLFDMPKTEIETYVKEGLKRSFSENLLTYEYGLMYETSLSFRQLPRQSIICVDFDEIPDYAITNALNELRAEIESITTITESIESGLNDIFRQAKRDSTKAQLLEGTFPIAAIDKKSFIYIEPSGAFQRWANALLGAVYGFFIKDSRGNRKEYIFNDTTKVYLGESELQGGFYRVSLANKEEFLNMDLRSFLENELELQGKFARVNRENEIEIIDIKKQFYLKPNTDLIPDENLKPLGVNGGSIGKHMYSECWYEESYTKPYGAAYAKYKGTDNADYEMYVYCPGFNEETDLSEYVLYDITNNEIIKNGTHTDEEIQNILQTIVDSISGVTYVPVQLKTVALPYVEIGDTLEVLTENNDSITTIVLKRSTSGESYITDEITSK